MKYATIKTPEQRHGVFPVTLEHISHLFLVFPLLTLHSYMFPGLLFLKNHTLKREESHYEVELIGV